jgi:hypothetical protein
VVIVTPLLSGARIRRTEDGFRPGPYTPLRRGDCRGALSCTLRLNRELAPDLYRVINDNKDIKEVEKIEPVLH